MNKQLRSTTHILAIFLMMSSMQNLLANQIWFSNTSDEEIVMRVDYSHLWESKTSRKEFKLSPDEDPILCTPGDIYQTHNVAQAENQSEHLEFFVASINLILQRGDEAPDAIIDIYMMRHDKNPRTTKDRILKVVYQGGGSFDITFNVVVKK